MKPTLAEEKSTTENNISFSKIPTGPFCIVVGSNDPRNHQRVAFSSVSGCKLTILSTWADGYIAYSAQKATGTITISSTNSSDYGVREIKASLITLT